MQGYCLCVMLGTSSFSRSAGLEARTRCLMWNEGGRVSLEFMKTEKNPYLSLVMSDLSGTVICRKDWSCLPQNCTCAIWGYKSLEGWYCGIGRSCRPGFCHTLTRWLNRSMKGTCGTEIAGILPWTPKRDGRCFTSAFPILCTFPLRPTLTRNHTGKRTVGSTADAAQNHHTLFSPSDVSFVIKINYLYRNFFLWV